MGDAEPAGLGGFCHGLFWYFQIPADDVDVVNIPLLEFMAAIFNIVTIEPHVRALAGADNFQVTLRTDALTTALTIPAQSQRTR